MGGRWEEVKEGELGLVYKIKINNKEKVFFYLCHHYLSAACVLCICISTYISTISSSFCHWCLCHLCLHIYLVSLPLSPSLPLSHLYLFLPFLSVPVCISTTCVCISVFYKIPGISAPLADLHYCGCFGQMLSNGMTAAFQTEKGWLPSLGLGEDFL